MDDGSEKYQIIDGIFGIAQFAWPHSLGQPHIPKDLILETEHGLGSGMPSSVQAYCPAVRCRCDKIIASKMITAYEFKNPFDNHVPTFVAAPGWYCICEHCGKQDNLSVHAVAECFEKLQQQQTGNSQQDDGRSDTRSESSLQAVSAQDVDMETASETSSVATAVSEDVESLREQIQNLEEVANSLAPQINLHRSHKDIEVAYSFCHLNVAKFQHFGDDPTEMARSIPLDDQEALNHYLDQEELFNPWYHAELERRRKLMKLSEIQNRHAEFDKLAAKRLERLRKLTTVPEEPKAVEVVQEEVPPPPENPFPLRHRPQCQKHAVWMTERENQLEPAQSYFACYVLGCQEKHLPYSTIAKTGAKMKAKTPIKILQNPSSPPAKARNWP